MKRVWVLLGVLGALALFLILGCVPAATPTAAPPAAPTAAPTATAPPVAAPKYGGTLKVVAQASVPSLDCDFTTAYVCGSIHLHIQEGLFALDENFVSQPQLVDKWSVSADGLTYTFSLRDAKWHDGRPVTSADAIQSLNRWMLRQAPGKATAAFVQGMQEVDSKTFTIKLKEPFGVLVTHIGALRYRPIIRPAEIAAISPLEDVGPDKATGSGPYKLLRWEKGNRVVVEKFQDYKPRTEPGSNFAGGQKGYLDKIEWLEIPSEETKVAGLKTGEWDIVDGVGLDFYKGFKAHPDIAVAMDKPGKQPAIPFNVTKPPTDNAKFRQAILAAVDAEAYMTALGERDLWILCPAFLHCLNPSESKAGAEFYNQNNPEKARQLLKEAGYKGEPVLVMNPTDYSTITPIGMVLKPMLEKIGINVDMPAMNWATLISRAPDLKYWNIRTTWHGFYGIHDPINDFFVGANAEGGYKSAKMMALRDQYAKTLDPKEQKRIVDELNIVYYEEVPFLGLGQFFSISPYRKWVKGFTRIYAMPNYNNAWLDK